MSPSSNATARRVAARAASTVARSAFASTAVLAAQGRGVAPLPKGMRGSGIFRRDENAVTLAPVPTRRAVKIGKQYWNSKTLRALLAQNPAATNPLTRQPLPASVVRKYSPGLDNRAAEAVKAAGIARRILGLSPRAARRRAARAEGFVGEGAQWVKNLRYSMLDFWSKDGKSIRVVLHGDDDVTVGIFRMVGNSLVFNMPMDDDVADEQAPYRTVARAVGYLVDSYIDSNSNSNSNGGWW